MVKKRPTRTREVVFTLAEIERLKAMLMDAECSIGAVKYYLALKAASARIRPGDVATFKEQLAGGGTPCGRRLAERAGGVPCVEAYDEST